MNAGTRIAAVLIALASLGLGACSTTLVETLPAGKRTTCDASWPGRWVVTSENPNKPGEPEDLHILEINADCTEWKFVDKEKTEVERLTATLVSTRSGDFISIFKPGDKLECVGEEQAKRCGLEINRYERAGNEIRIYEPDHRGISKTIRSHPGMGWTRDTEPEQATTDPAETSGSAQAENETATATAEPDAAAANPPQQPPASPNEPPKETAPTYQNLIYGNAAQINRVLGQHPEFFKSTPWLILRRATKPAESNKP